MRGKILFLLGLVLLQGVLCEFNMAEFFDGEWRLDGHIVQEGPVVESQTFQESLHLRTITLDEEVVLVGEWIGADEGVRSVKLVLEGDSEASLYVRAGEANLTEVATKDLTKALSLVFSNFSSGALAAYGPISTPFFAPHLHADDISQNSMQLLVLSYQGFILNVWDASRPHRIVYHAIKAPKADPPSIWSQYSTPIMMVVFVLFSQWMKRNTGEEVQGTVEGEATEEEKKEE